MIASKARFGLIPLRYGFWWAGLRGIRPPLAEEARRRIGFRAVREGGVIASKARSGLTPLRYGFWWAARVWVDRFWSAPTGHCIPARGGTPGKAKPESTRSEGTPHSAQIVHRRTGILQVPFVQALGAGTCIHSNCNSRSLQGATQGRRQPVLKVPPREVSMPPIYHLGESVFLRNPDNRPSRVCLLKAPRCKICHRRRNLQNTACVLGSVGRTNCTGWSIV